MANADNDVYLQTECPDSQCVEWTGPINNWGYGVAKYGRSSTTAHRVAWINAYGPIPDGLVIDHLCRNKRCVNLDHLEAVTPLVNLRRAIGPVKTHCPKGHPLEGDNLYLQMVRGEVLGRSCRTCRNERSRRRYAK